MSLISSHYSQKPLIAITLTQQTKRTWRAQQETKSPNEEQTEDSADHRVKWH